MSNISSINAPINQQLANNAPLPSGLVTVTSPLLPDQQVLARMSNFPAATYSLNYHSHLVKLMGVLLGPAGGGQLRQRALVNRMREGFSSTFFSDLDSFWGAILGIARQSSEQLVINPYTTAAPYTTWIAMSQADSTYRDRLYQAIRAIANYGPSPIGIQKVAEAILLCPVELTENYYASPTGQYAWYVTLTPHAVITQVQEMDLLNILSRIKPANVVVKLASLTGSPYLAVPLRGAYASTSYYEIVATSSSSEIYGSDIIPQYAFGSSQSGYWNLNSSVAGSLSYAYNPDGTVLTATDFERVVWADGTATNYGPQYALASAANSILGNIGVPGIASANPINNTTSVSALLLAGAAPNVIAENITINSSGTGPQFWSTPERAYTDQTQDVIEVRFLAEATIDSVSFELANFPHTAYLQIYDDANGNWVTYYTQTVATSAPSIFPNPTEALINKTHPQHFGPDHWLPVSVRPAPITVTRARIILVRPGPGGPSGPVSAMPSVSTGEPLQPYPYSLGVSELSFDYVVDSQAVLPTLGGTIGMANDALGNMVTYSLYQENPTGPIASEPTQWRSSPQPANNTVVNYYVDARTQAPNGVVPVEYSGGPGSGGLAGTTILVGSVPQVIDRFYVEPTHQGVRCNLYYTTDLPNGEGEALDNPLGEIGGTGVTITSVGAVFSTSAIGYLWSGTGIQSAPWDWPIGDWWLGMSIQLNAAMLTSTITLLDMNGVTLQLANGQLQFYANSTTTSTEQNLAATTVASFVLSYSVELNEYSLQVANGGVISPSSYTTVANGVPSVLGFDSIYIGGTAGPTGMTLLSLVLKGETITPSNIDGFLSNPSSYCVKPTYQTQVGNTNNAYLRFDPSFVSVSATCLLGGTPDIMGNLNWVPVVQSYVLTTGYMTFPPVAANFWKFEMTGLASEPLQNPFPQTTTVQMFGTNAIAPTVPPDGYQGALPAGVATQIAGASGNTGLTVPGITAGLPSGSYTPTEAAIAPDPTNAAILAGAFPSFKYVDWHTGGAVPQTTGGIENYSSVQLSPVNQLGFYCGFKTLQAYRTKIYAALDTPLYYERFDDAVNIYSATIPTIGGITTSEGITVNQIQVMSAEVSVTNGENITATCQVDANELSTGYAEFALVNIHGISVASQNVAAGTNVLVELNYTATTADTWLELQGYVDGTFVNFVSEVTYGTPTWTGGSGLTGVTFSPVATVVSNAYVSNSNVTHVQFATSQSPAVEIVLNDQFRNAQYINYTWDNIADWNVLGDAQISFNPQTFVPTISRGISQYSVSQAAGIVIPPVSPVLMESTPPSVTLTDGGLQSAPFVTSPVGYLYPAIRMTVLQGLTNPIFVQLRNATNGDVVIEWQVDAVETQTVEQTFSYQIGSAIDPSIPLTVCVYQSGTSTDVWSVAALSVFDASILWSFSTDGATWQNAMSSSLLRNNVNGVLTLATPGTSLYWKCQLFRTDLHVNSIKIRPMYAGSAGPQVAPIASGPTITFTDPDQTIWTDPEFNGWLLPVPMWWFARYQQDTTLFPENVPFITSYSGLYFETVNESVGPANVTGIWGQYTPFVTVYEHVGPGTLAPSWGVSGGIAGAASSTAITLAAPSGIVAGDQLLGYVNTEYGAGTITAPPGWTFVTDAAASATVVSYLYAKTATASEPATYTWTGVGGGFNAFVTGVVVNYHGLQIDGTAYAPVSNGPSEQTTITAPSVNTTVVNDWVVIYYNNPVYSPGLTFPGGVNQRVNVPADSIFIADFIQSTIGATPAQAATISNGQPDWNAITVALKPVPVSSGAVDTVTTSIISHITVSESVGPATGISNWYPPQPITTTFGYTGTVQYWTVPEVYEGTATFTLVGAAGGNANGSALGGLGTDETFTIAVVAGHVLAIYVGQQGQVSTTLAGGLGGWGFGTGGTGGMGYASASQSVGGPGGGGSTAVVDTTTGTLLAVAAAGGGGATIYGNRYAPGGNGGTPVDGTSGFTGYPQGGAGSLAGPGGSEVSGFPGGPGSGPATSFGTGNGGSVVGYDGLGMGAGAGGAGYYGGDANGGYENSSAQFNTFSGNGGSSWIIPSATNPSYTLAVTQANGGVSITYTPF